MNASEPLTALLILVLSLAAVGVILLYTGLIKVWIAFAKRDDNYDIIHEPFIEIIVPVKGANQNQRIALLSLLKQDYSSYSVTLVVESEDDPASAVVDKICGEDTKARKLIAGFAKRCGQKNHNLVYALNRLKPETEIVVFCDSTNVASPQWLARFTASLRTGNNDVVTTFRRFFPRPQNIPGVCQTMYGVVVLLLASVAPKPWGGGTAIRRDILDKLPLKETWSKTVVDDLVLGNILRRAGIKVFLDAKNLLSSPLNDHSLSSFFGYLDRQIMFPKFTNNEMWGTLLVLYVNLSIAVPLALWETAWFILRGGSDWPIHYVCVGLVGTMMILVLCVRRLVTPHISLVVWLLSLLPLLFIGAFIFLRSVTRGFIDWHGKRYWCGNEGVVERVEDINYTSV